MSDSFEDWFFPELEREGASKAKENILRGFWKRGLIETENNPDLVLGHVDEAYGPTEKLAALYSKPDGLGGVSLSLWTRGMGVHEGFALDGFELSYMEKIICPGCQTSNSFKETGLIEAMEIFHKTQIIPEIKCPVCGDLHDARHWRGELHDKRWQSEPQFTFCYLGFKFWNWPPLKGLEGSEYDPPGVWKVDIPNLMEELAQSPVSFLYGHF